MIIDTKTVIITLIIIAFAAYVGLHMIRSFALTIAQENHAANLQMDTEEETLRLKRLREADDLARAAFTKVEPLVKEKMNNQSSGGENNV